MAHARKQIRDAIVGELTGLATTGSRVFASRIYPLEQTDLPGLLVATESETVTQIDIGALQERTLTVKVEALAKATADLDNALDQICLEVEIALATLGATLAALTRAVSLQTTDLEYDGSGAQPIGRASMVFLVTYFTQQAAPATAL